jgi:diguanylate cyclase
MSPRLRSTRRQNQTYAPDREDIRWDLAAIAMGGYLPMVLLSGVCQVSAVALAANYYHDFWLWAAAATGLLFSILRAVVVYGFEVETKKEAKNRYAFWSAADSISLLLLSSLLATLNVYTFRVYDLAVQALCVFGSFTLGGGITARLSIVPRVSQACVLILQGSLAYALVITEHPLIRYATVLALVMALTSCISIENQYQVFDEQARTRRRLKNLATHDWLTGLPNRHHFETALEQACESGKPFTLWMLDLDGFKGVNDTYGHAAGDELLRQVAHRLERAVRTGDLLARLGGDEFVILQSQVLAREATRKLAERIGATISVPYLIAGNKIVISASVGIKLAESEGQDPDSALLEADCALYRVKDFGHGGFEMV